MLLTAILGSKCACISKYKSSFTSVHYQVFGFVFVDFTFFEKISSRMRCKYISGGDKTFICSFAGVTKGFWQKDRDCGWFWKRFQVEALYPVIYIQCELGTSVNKELEANGSVFVLGQVTYWPYWGQNVSLTAGYLYKQSQTNLRQRLPNFLEKVSSSCTLVLTIWLEQNKLDPHKHFTLLSHLTVKRHFPRPVAADVGKMCHIYKKVTEGRFHGDSE